MHIFPLVFPQLMPLPASASPCLQRAARTKVWPEGVYVFLNEDDDDDDDDGHIDGSLLGHHHLHLHP